MISTTYTIDGEMPTCKAGKLGCAAEGADCHTPGIARGLAFAYPPARWVTAEHRAIRTVDTIARMGTSCAGRITRLLARSLAAAVLSTTHLPWLVSAADAATECPENAPLVRHGPVESAPEAESGVLLRHALIGSSAKQAAATTSLPARETVFLEELGSILESIRTAWPDMAAVTARPLWEPGTLILELGPALGGAIAEALPGPGVRVPFCTGHVKFDALNRRVGLRSITPFPHLPNLYRTQFDPARDVPGIAAQYTSIEGVVAAMPDARLGDGPGIQALRSERAWFLVFRDAWGDCPSGCMFSKLHFYVSDERRIARIDCSDAVRMEEFSAILAARGWRPR
jgi:hypothetical protein